MNKSFIVPYVNSIFLQGVRIAIFENQSATTKIVSRFLHIVSKSIRKFMETFSQWNEGMGKDVYNPFSSFIGYTMVQHSP